MTATRGQYLIGRVLGSCVLESVLGYGGSSAVFLAQQSSPMRKVAVKVFLPRTGMDKRMQMDFYRRFLHEAQSTSKLDHPNIVPIYSYGEEEGLPYIVMPYMPGGTLAGYMAKRRPLSLEEAQWHLEQLAAALDYAHAHGCVHCDVKPANILLDHDGRVLLSDFGISRLTRTDLSADLTNEAGADNSPVESVMGTPDYISPEQALGRGLDGRSDVYSLAITLFFLLSKRLPFRSDTPIALALQHVHETPPSLALLRADISPLMDRVMHKALAKDPADRFQTPGEFSMAFSATLATTSSGKHSALLQQQYPGLLESSASTPFTPLPPSSVVTRSLTQSSSWRPSDKRVTALLTGFLLLVLLISMSLFFLYRPHPTAVLHTLPIKHLHPTPTVAQSASIDLLASADNWPVNRTFFFDQQKQHYHIVNSSSNSVALAPYYGSPLNNFLLHVTATVIRSSSNGPDFYGVVFRASPDQSAYYLFEVAPNENTQYAFLRYDGNGRWDHLRTGLASSLLTGPGALNTLTITAHGNQFAFTINGTLLDTVVDDNDRALSSGLVGLYVESQGTEVAFSHLYVTPLK